MSDSFHSLKQDVQDFLSNALIDVEVSPPNPDGNQPLLVKPRKDHRKALLRQILTRARLVTKEEHGDVLDMVGF